MSNRDEETIFETRETPVAQGQSDIDAFAGQTPVGANKTHEKVHAARRKKRVVWLATLGAVAVLAATLSVFLFVINPTEEEPEPDIPDTAVTLVDKQLNDDGTEIDVPITDIAITSRLDSYRFSLNKDDVLQLEGEENIATNTTAVEHLVDALTYIQAEDTVATGLSDMAEYGLNNPTATVSVTYADGETVKLELASLAVGNHYYLRLNGGDTVYLLDSSLADEVLQTAEAFVSLSVVAAPSPSPDDENGTAVLKQLSLSGPVRNNVVTTVRRKEPEDSGEFENTAYLISAPYLMATDSNAVTKVFTITNIQAEEVVALHPTEEEKKTYGLDTPQSVALMSLAILTGTSDEEGNIEASGYYNEITHALLLGNKTADGKSYYATVDGRDAIYRLSAEDVPWATMTYHDFANQYLFLRNLNTLDSIACTLDGQTYNFQFEHFPEAEELDDQLKVTVGDKTYPTDEFRTLYQVLMTLFRTGPAPARPTGEPLLTVRVTSLDKSFSVNEVRIYPYSGSVYIAQTETGDTYKMTASRVDDAIQQIRNYLNGAPVINRF